MTRDNLFIQSPRKRAWGTVALLLCGALPFLWSGTLQAQSSRDVRVALLIAHQHGWQGDPTLRYVITGDLLPLKKILSRNGFEVVALQNPSPQKVRATFLRLQARKDIKTFLFYYSGHGGKKYFHLGPRKKMPLSHDEFIGFFRKLRVKRRIAFIDACFSGSLIRRWGKKKLRRWARLKVRPKGAKYANFSILTKAKKYKTALKGTQIITSSQSYSYESQLLKSSVFTHYLLKGLRGQADLNGDGQVSVREIYGYIQPKVKKRAEQSPRRWTQVEGGDYGLTPNQTSHLLLHAGLVGHLSVSVGNFHWRYQKNQRLAIKLRVIHGKGVVELKRGRQCYRQKVALPKGGQVRLGFRWKTVSCKRPVVALAQKGSIGISSEISQPVNHSLGVQGGLFGSPIGGSSFLTGGALLYRRNFFALQLGTWGSNVDYPNSPRSHQLLLDIRGNLGFRYHWRRMDWFIGGYAGLGLLFQNLTGDKTIAGTLFHYGVTSTLGVWLTSTMSWTLSGDFGFTLLKQGRAFRNPLGASIRTGFLFRFE